MISEISQKLKDDFSEGTEYSKIKIIYRFFSSSTINPDYVYSFFIEEILKKYVKRSKHKKVIIIIDGRNKIEYLRDITHAKTKTNKFN